jgi:rubrerythrin
MNLSEAIDTAIKYETRIRDLYREAAKKTNDPAGQRVYRYLGDDEQNHLDYLMARRQEWKASGKITVLKLKSMLPPKELMAQELNKIKEQLASDDLSDEKQMLSWALKVEIETSQFYQKMVGEMTGDGQEMFAQFLSIENGHIDVVQAELDYISHTGYWMDIKEFGLEEL